MQAVDYGKDLCERLLIPVNKLSYTARYTGHFMFGT